MDGRRVSVGVFGLVLLMMFPLPAAAQSAIAGVVRDTSGALLPGVTVEARSPALIDQVRSTVTNGEGQYRLVDLRPGVYSVSFSLTGFSPVRRENITLEANFTAPINVEMQIGGLEETITVSGGSPVVDVQQSARRSIVSQELLETLPTGRNFQLAATTLPGVTTGGFDVGGSSTMWSGGSVNVHGSISQDSVLQIDGMRVDAMFSGGQCSCLYSNEAQTQEIAVQISGGAAESQTSGPQINRVPRIGGNRFTGELTTTFANSNFQSTNISDSLRAQGLSTGDRLAKAWDINPSLGGPIIRDRLWFFFSARHWAYNNYVAGTFNPDGSQAIDDNNLKAYPIRLTAQVTPSNRVTALYEYTSKWRGHRDLNANTSPEAAVEQSTPASYITQAKWTGTVGQSLLLETGFNVTKFGYKLSYRPEVERSTCFTAFVECAPGTGYGDIRHIDLSTGLSWGSAPTDQEWPMLSQVLMSAVSYVTGAHATKVGYQYRWGSSEQRYRVNGGLHQRYRNGVADSVVVYNSPAIWRSEVSGDFGVFAQDSWTMHRLTLNTGLRYDYFASQAAELSIDGGRFVPERHFPAIDAPTFHNVSPRIGAVYDLFGDSKTALKFHVGQYVQSEGTGRADDINPSALLTDARTWNDLNGDDIAQENELGPSSISNFGARQVASYEEDFARGKQWLYNVEIQHEVATGIGVSLSYNRREFRNLEWDDNVLVSPADHTLVLVPDPSGNGRMLELYNLNAALLGQVDTVIRNGDPDLMKRWYQGVDATFNVRRSRGTVSGGVSIGRTMQVTCQDDAPNPRLDGKEICDDRQWDVPWNPLYRLSGTYELPYGLRVSGVFRSQQGNEITNQYSVGRSIVPSLTRASVNVRLTAPRSLWYGRVNQIDLNVGKSFRFANDLEVRPTLSLFNMLNSNPVLAQVTTWGPRLGIPTGVLAPRLARFDLMVKF